LAFGFSLAALVGIVCTVDAQDGGDTVMLTWTAVGDDSLTRDASLYDIRYSTDPITDENWFDAQRGKIFRPHAPGTIERCYVTQLDPRTDYYFAVRTMDYRGNLSKISNLAIRRGRGIGIEEGRLAVPVDLLSLAAPR